MGAEGGSVDCSDDGSADGEWYDIVRHSDGAVVSEVKLREGDRVLLRRDAHGVGHKCLFPDERFVSQSTLAEMVRELICKN